MSIFGGSAKKAREDAARDRDADRQLAAGRTTRHRQGQSSRKSARPENAGLDDRAIDALERENSKGIGGRNIAVSGRAGRARRGGNHKR